MITYIVKVTTLCGRGKRIFRAGEIVSSDDFYPSAIPALLRNKFIEEYTPLPPIVPSDPFPHINKIKLAIVTGVWGRPEVFELFSQGIENLLEWNEGNESMKIQIEVIVAGSEGMTSKKMVTSKGYHYIEIKNDPLATKMNSTILAAKELNCSHVLCVGSDDIITPALLEKYIQFIKQGYDYIGVLDWYFYDTVTKKSLYWGGYRDLRRQGHTCGAGRILSANLLSKWDWKVWEDRHSRILDNSMQEKLKVTKHSIKTFSLKEFGLYALDIKSSTNMTPFDKWDNADYIDSQIIKNKFNFLNL